MARLHWFGRMIGNSDMHPGNLGFQLTDRGPLALAPVYDMLPMSLAPTSSGAMRPATALALGAPARSAKSDAIGWAARLAERFWLQVAASERIRSEDLKRIAHDNAAVVARYSDSFASR
jgi:serine/threonine protein kinase HipA of HipAB toxin-antitoxin module